MFITKYNKDEILKKMEGIIDNINEKLSDCDTLDVSFNTLWNLDEKNEINENELLLDILVDGDVVKTVDLTVDILRVSSDSPDHSHILPLFFLKKQLSNVINDIEESIKKNIEYISDEPDLLEKVKEVMSGKLSLKEYNKWEKQVYYNGEIGD